MRVLRLSKLASLHGYRTCSRRSGLWSHKLAPAPAELQDQPASRFCEYPQALLLPAHSHSLPPVSAFGQMAPSLPGFLAWKPHTGAQEAWLRILGKSQYIFVSFPEENVFKLESVSSLEMSSKYRVHAYCCEKRDQARIRASNDSEPLDGTPRIRGCSGTPSRFQGQGLFGGKEFVSLSSPILSGYLLTVPWLF